MAPRVVARSARENDFSNVGKTGRRTGVTLPQGRLDVNGMEEITGIFSSPRKSSPLKQSVSIVESIEVQDTNKTPTQSRLTRKPLPARSASPRKSGISGTARRGKAVDVLGPKEAAEEQSPIQQDAHDTPARSTPNAPNTAQRFSPQKTPLRHYVLPKPQTAGGNTVEEDGTINPSMIETPDDDVDEVVADEPTVDETETEEHEPELPAATTSNDSMSATDVPHTEAAGFEPLPPQFDDEDADETFQPGKRAKPASRERTIANSRKKRKSDAADHETDVEVVSSPAAKRAKRISDEGSKRVTKAATKSSAAVSESRSPAHTVEKISKPRKKVDGKGKSRAPQESLSTNNQMSSQQKDQLNDVVEKIKNRPGPKRSLYVLRRETPAEDGVTHTRSGRISVKPLAYWRNEKCVFGGSPGGVSLQDGARFPLNSIKEIVRSEQVDDKVGKRSKKGKGGRPKKVTSTTQRQQVESESSDEDEEDGGHVNPDAEPWESEIGTFRGAVSIWDPEQQAPVQEEEEIDLAYAPAAIQTREVPGSTFRYAKLLSTRFFGTGLVELPAGAVKKSKNSRKMHMSFFVATGRVTVCVGPMNQENRFSIGKGGFWQVPRGNQYSIENEHEKTAKVFFSQACEPAPQDLED